MKKILNLIVMLVISLLMLFSCSFAQNNQQKKNNKMGNQNMKTQNSMQADTNYNKSMAYYNYAKKNIIEDKTKDKTYKGRFHDQNNMNMKSSKSNMMNSSSKMMKNSKHKMGKKNMMRDTTGPKMKKP